MNKQKLVIRRFQLFKVNLNDVFWPLLVKLGSKILQNHQLGIF